ncbi:regulatory protein, gntR family [Eubacterium aggregans]|uniref:Regulatory protein, gntR family n=1 Tax=Eubacterium aggregans TaxID=81409 RepID=A0A1H3Z8E4_9FIRM|nr:GntR family transcriptional regulator [Eubacterium aggregans]SEA19788.1 regulatory protein, gntR family [Eubacterium aggregans]
MKTYEFILNDIQSKIESGIYKPEEQLPSLREFSKIYTTTPVTVKKSLAILEEQGYVYVVDRKGFFVSSGTHKAYTMIFHEIKGIDHVTEIRLEEINETNGADIKKRFGLEVPEHTRCLRITRILYDCDMPIGIDKKYIIHNARSDLLIRSPERFLELLNLVLGNYDIHKELEMTMMTDNTPVRDILFLGADDGVFEFKQTYRTENGQLVGVSETYVPCEEIQLKMKY